jgi:GTP-binding protein EngB required for normal cell division
MTTAPFDLRFVMSAPRVEDLPPTQSEVAFAGRSNVGKSSLIKRPRTPQAARSGVEHTWAHAVAEPLRAHIRRDGG